MISGEVLAEGSSLGHRRGRVVDGSGAPGALGILRDGPAQVPSREITCSSPSRALGVWPTHLDEDLKYTDPDRDQQYVQEN
jgi:hypothetical protein